MHQSVSLPFVSYGNSAIMTIESHAPPAASHNTAGEELPLYTVPVAMGATWGRLSVTCIMRVCTMKRRTMLAILPNVESAPDADPSRKGAGKTLDVYAYRSAL